MLRILLTTFACVAVLCAAESGSAPATSAAAMQASLQKQRESLDRQRNSLRHQTAGSLADDPDSSGFIAPLIPPVQLDCLPLPSNEVDALVSPAARKAGIAMTLLHAVMKQESGFRPCAVSEKGALGLMQLMPATADQFHVADPFDPVQNVEAGAALLKQLLNRYRGDLRLTLAAYNAGANRADQTTAAVDHSYPAETQRYIAAIFADLGMQKVQASAGLQDDPPVELSQSDSSTPAPQQ